MNLKRRIAAYSMMSAAVAAIASTSGAGEVALQYESFPVTSEAMNSYWSDMANLAVQHGELPTEVFVARFEATDGELLVTMLGAPGACGMNECPIRVFRDGQKIADLNACSNKDTHAMNESGRLLMACDAIIPIGRP